MTAENREPFQIHATQTDYRGEKYFLIPDGTDEEAAVLAVLVDRLYESLYADFPDHLAWSGGETKEARYWVTQLITLALMDDDGTGTRCALEAFCGIVRLFAEAGGFAGMEATP